MVFWQNQILKRIKYWKEMFDPRDVIAITGGENWSRSDKFNCQRKENWRDDNEMPLARHDRKSS
jgi:hypothetical protein